MELFSYLKQGKNMKNLYGKVVLTAAFYAGVMAEALANPFCGDISAGEPPCDVPEPSSAYLFLGAAAVAGIVIKLRKKK